MCSYKTTVVSVAKGKEKKKKSGFKFGSHMLGIVLTVSSR